MTTLNFALTRTAAREFRAGDEIVVTRLDHDANVSPWLELAHDLGLVVRFVGPERGHDARPGRPRAAARRADEGRRVPARGERRRHAHRRAADRRAGARGRRARVGGRRALRAARPDRRRGARRRRAHLLAVQVLRPAPRASRSRAASCSSRGGRTRCARRRTSRSASASRRARSRTSCSPASSRPSSTSSRSAGTRSARTSARSASASSRACRTNVTLHGLPTMDGRVPTFAFTHAGRTPREIADAPRRPGHRRLARRLLRARGDAAARPRRRTAPSAPASSTTTPAEEVDRLLEALSRELLILGGTKFLGRAVVDAALARGHERDALQPRPDEPRALPGGRAAARRPRRRPRRARAAASGTPSSTRAATCRASCAHRRSCSRDAVGHYAFVSSVSVYADSRRAADESSAVGTIDDATVEEVMEHYGAAEGALRARRAGRPRRARADRAPGPDRRPARPDRPLHVLAARESRAAATCSRPGRRSGRCSSSTSATSARGS